MIDYVQALNAKIYAKHEIRPVLASMGQSSYVYVLWEFLPDGLIPFYVGMGKQFRALSHEMVYSDADWTNKEKRDIIGRIAERGEEVLYSLACESVSPSDAYQEERRLIAFVGRLRDGTGPLTNRNAGGGGVRGHRALAVIANGVRYDSLVAAAADLAMTKPGISHRIRAGHPGYYWEHEGQRPLAKGARIDRPIKKTIDRGPTGRGQRAAILVDGKLYRSGADAADAAAITYSAARNRCGSPDWPGWKFTSAERQSAAEYDWKDKSVRFSNPVDLDGVIYANLRSALTACQRDGRKVIAITTKPKSEIGVAPSRQEKS
jgi:hypothetical protein